MQTDTGTSTAQGAAPGEAAAGAPDDGRSFSSLIEARYALWRGVSDLDEALYQVKGDLSAIHAMSLELTERHQHTLGTTADGLHHCASRALDALRGLQELHRHLHEAAVVVRENDPTRLSAEALRARFEPGPHRETS